MSDLYLKKSEDEQHGFASWNQDQGKWWTITKYAAILTILLTEAIEM